MQLRIGGLHVVHGGWSDPIDEYLKWTETYFDQIPGNRFGSGHTHIPVIHTSGGKTYCNPGSVGQPRDNDPRAAFATYDGEFTLHRRDYDPQPVFDLMKEAGFSDYYYGCLKTGARRLAGFRSNATRKFRWRKLGGLISGGRHRLDEGFRPGALRFDSTSASASISLADWQPTAMASS